MRVFETHPQLRAHRLCKVGLRRHTLYLCPDRTDRIEVWSLHSFIPNSWRRVCLVPVIELLYASYTLSQAQPLIYALVVALFDCDVPCISVLAINVEEGRVERFDLDGASGEEFENRVFLENVLIGSGPTRLFLYDRSIVMGDIPFWNIHLLNDSKTFVIESAVIRGEGGEERCTRFPVVLDGDTRKVLRVRDTEQLSVYDGTEDTWHLYQPSAHSLLDLGAVAARGVSETYGRSGHRVGAVESLLSLFTDGDTLIAKVFKNGRHTFYSIQLDDDAKTYRILPASSCTLPESIQQRFYAACSASQFVFICSKGIAFVPLRPPSLRELSFLSVQLQHSTLSGGVWSGGISEQCIKDLCSCKYQHPLV